MPVLSSIVARTPAWLRIVVLILLIGLFIRQPAQRAEADAAPSLSLAIIAPNAGGSYLADTTLTFEATWSGCADNFAGGVVFTIHDDTTGTESNPAVGLPLSDPHKLTYTAPFHTVGQFIVSAVFKCNTTNIFVFGIATSKVTFDITADTTTTLSVAPTPLAYGAPVTLTASVTPAARASSAIVGRSAPAAQLGGLSVGPSILPTGTVSFFLGSTMLGTAPVDQSLGQAAFTTTAGQLPAGTGPKFSAVYNGDQFNKTSTGDGPVSQVIDASTTTTVTSSTNPAAGGHSVSFTATVTNTAIGSTAVPTGSVNFTLIPATTGGSLITGSGTLAPTGTTTAQATFATADLVPAGSPYQVTATYPAVSGFATSLGSQNPAQTVTGPATSAPAGTAATAASPAAATTAPSQASTTASTTAATTTTTATAPATASQPGGAASGTSAVPATGPSTGMSVTYPAGWNLVAGCAAGMPQAAATLYTFQAQDTDYESSPNTNALTTGQGYWAFFAQQATVGLPAGCAGGQSVRAPGGRYIMLGNSTQSSLTLHGLGSGDQALTYNASTGQYTDITGTPSLAPGQGAWVYVANDATLSLG